MWDLSGLIGEVDVDFSTRLKSTWGRSRVDARRVRLHPDLETTHKHLLDEVLCHELAHIAVFEKFGPGKQPHGKEWTAFVRQAGFEPRLRLEGAEKASVPTQQKSRQFEHYCPVCQSVRYAKQPMTRWRCAQCSNAGLEGKLLIRKAAA
jgi:predicted SprT family Zn-dependent metalloprotease